MENRIEKKHDERVEKLTEQLQKETRESIRVKAILYGMLHPDDSNSTGYIAQIKAENVTARLENQKLVERYDKLKERTKQLDAENKQLRTTVTVLRGLDAERSK